MALSNTLRIIGGKFRGRRLPFPSVEGLRPTKDSVRETLFNWLQRDIQGALCLDLFAGSGALGFEALSRGAAQVVMVDRSHEVVQQLKKNAETLGVDSLDILEADVAEAWPCFSQRFSIVFLDPPFASDILRVSLERISEVITENALIYIEVSEKYILPVLPSHFHILHEKKSGNVVYYLVQVAMF